MQVENKKPNKWLRRFLKLILVMLVLGAGLIGAAYIEKTAPKAKRRPRIKMPPLASVDTVKKTSERILIQAMGTVIPARKITLRSQASGRIESVHSEFIDGGLFKLGDVLLQIEKTDYKLALKMAETNIDAAMARNETARDNLKRSASLLPRRVISKQKHDIDKSMYKEAVAGLESQKASLARAELNLERTDIKAPFNGVIQSKKVDVGAVVSTQDQLADLVSTDEYHIRAAVPVDRLDWISIPRKNDEIGSNVRVFYGSGHERRGRVIKLLSDLEAAGQMARLIVAVSDPFNIKNPDDPAPPLLINQFVRLEIEGEKIEAVYRISRDALRDDSTVWIADENDRLVIRNVKVVWRAPNAVYLIDGLKSGERLIVSNLAAPVAGMAIRVEGREPKVEPGERRKGRREKTDGQPGAKKTKTKSKRQ